MQLIIRDLIYRSPLKPNYLSAGIDSIRTAYGSVETYLREELGADIGKLREFYLD